MSKETVWLVSCFDHKEKLAWTYAFRVEQDALDFEMEHSSEYEYVVIHETDLE